VGRYAHGRSLLNDPDSVELSKEEEVSSSQSYLPFFVGAVSPSYVLGC
jgi:hypothetical protein